jgi:hypothetical protein
MPKKKITEAEAVVMAAKAEAPVVPVATPPAVVPVQTSLTEYKMPVRNGCFKCGAEIPEGGRVFAFSLNAVVAGGGLCAKCAERI